MCSIGLGSPGGHFPVGTPTVALESCARILGRYIIDLPFYTWNGTSGCSDDVTLQTIEGWRPETNFKPTEGLCPKENWIHGPREVWMMGIIPLRSRTMANAGWSRAPLMGLHSLQCSQPAEFQASLETKGLWAVFRSIRHRVYFFSHPCWKQTQGSNVRALSRKLFLSLVFL